MEELVKDGYSVDALNPNLPCRNEIKNEKRFSLIENIKVNDLNLAKNNDVFKQLFDVASLNEFSLNTQLRLMGKRLRLWKEYYLSIDHPPLILDDTPEIEASKPDAPSPAAPSAPTASQKPKLKKHKKPKTNIETDYGKLMAMEDILFHWISPSFATIKDMERSFTGDGIVMCVNDKYAPMAIAAITMIREIFNCELPIEVFFMGEEDLSIENQEIMEALPSVRTVNIDHIFDTEHLYIWGWSVKSFALLASSFENAMLIDADIVFLQSPTEFFSNPMYLEHGALFFKDRTIPVVERKKYRLAISFLKNLFPLIENSERVTSNRFYQGASQHEQESGVVLINKKKRLPGLLATCILNSGNIRTETYKHIYGDKETFWMGFEIVDSAYIFNTYAPGAIGVSNNHKRTEMCSVQLIHVDHNRNPYWINGGLLHNKLHDPKKLANMQEWLLEPGVWHLGDKDMLCITGDKDQKAHRFVKKEIDAIDKALIIYSSTMDNFKKKKAKMPTQISPWSYMSTPCTDKTYNSQFEHWMKEKYQFWIHHNDYYYQHYRRELVLHLRKYKAPEVSFSGRGIVYSVHPRIFRVTAISILFLRHHGCTLPIEVWHNNELGADDIEAFLTMPDITVHNLADYMTFEFKRDSDKKIYAIKTAALIHSTLDEILFIDGDNFPLRDPTFLFDHPAFVETGAVFWKDFWKTRPDNPLWTVLGLDCVDEFEQESGQLLLKKTFHGVMESLSLAFFMQQRADFYFNLTPGDKDTFRLGWRLLGQPFHMVRPHVSVLGGFSACQHKFCGHSMVQYAPFWGENMYGPPPKGYQDPEEPEILFVHANSLKYRTDMDEQVIFGSLKHYDQPIVLDARGQFGPGICVHLLDSPTHKIVTTDFNAKHPEFEALYRKFYRRIIN